MCGIAGVLGLRDNAALLIRMNAAQRHRGPDGVGQHSDDRHHVGATRLSVIDPAAGAQPVFNETGKICVVFNGEIYNHNELRAYLQNRGHTFATRTDTEVIVHLYEEHGDDCVRYLQGMFAFAVLDRERLLLARDPLGIKPLYYCYLPSANVFIFASEIKAILCNHAFSPRINLQAMADTLALSHSVGSQTFFEGVHSLCPGHTMVVSGDASPSPGIPKRYSSRQQDRHSALSLEQAEVRLDSLLCRSVETHLAADVEVGVTLSGGLDSSILAAYAKEHRPERLRTFTVADHREHVDVVQAERIAHALGTTHQTIIMTFEDYLKAIPGLVASEEQPSSLFGLPFYFLCNALAERVKVSIHGEGADELFGGYVPYLDRESRLHDIRRRLPLLKHLGVRPSELAMNMIERLSRRGTFDEYLETLFDINMSDALERQHLVPVDKCAMASGVEIRVPYLDSAVVDFVSGLPLDFLVRRDLGVQKYILRRLALRRFGPPMIDVVLREKYGAPSAGVVMLDRFDRLCDEAVSDAYVARHEFEHCFRSKREVALFDIFHEIFIEHRGDSNAIGDVEDFIRSRSAKGRSPRRPTRSSAPAQVDEEEV